MTILGVPFGKGCENGIWEKVIDKVQASITKWSRRNLSRKGKLLIIKTILYSKVWHIAKVKGLDEKTARQLEKMAREYLWNPRKYIPMKTEVIKNSKERGGLEFPDIRNIAKAYLLMKVTDLINYPHKKWCDMLVYRLGSL